MKQKNSTDPTSDDGTVAAHQKQRMTIGSFTLNPLVTLDELVGVTRLSRAQIWRLRHNPSFPKAIQLSARRIAWRVEDVCRWLEERERMTGANE
jgi:predicted DNA-binding transcriptional regulator AlpA